MGVHSFNIGSTWNRLRELTAFTERQRLAIATPPCPTCQLWPFSSAQENHPKRPVQDPQNEFPGVRWIGLLLAFPYYVIGNPEFPGIFRHFHGEGFLGSPNRVFGGRWSWYVGQRLAIGDLCNLRGSGTSAKTTLLLRVLSATLIVSKHSNPPQWTVFASRRQGFTPTLRLVQNPINGRQAL